VDSKANVRDIDSLMRAKAVFAKARTELLQAVSEAVSHAELIDAWVERDGPLRWETERRRAAEAVAAAKSALYRKEMTPAIDGGKVSVVDERKALQRANARLDRIEGVLRRIRAMRAEVTREIGLLKAGLGPIGAWIDSDAVEAQSTITRMAEALARYRGDEVDIETAARARGDAPRERSDAPRERSDAPREPSDAPRERSDAPHTPEGGAS